MQIFLHVLVLRASHHAWIVFVSRLALHVADGPSEVLSGPQGPFLKS